jgi:hypothetical protein
MTPNEYKGVLAPHVDHCDVEPPVFFFEDSVLVGRFVYNECQVFSKDKFIVWGRQPELAFVLDEVRDGGCFMRFIHDRLKEETLPLDITNDYLTLEGRYLNIKKIDEQ